MELVFGMAATDNLKELADELAAEAYSSGTRRAV